MRMWDLLELGLEVILTHRSRVLETKLYTLQEQCVLITELSVACVVALESHTLLRDPVLGNTGYQAYLPTSQPSRKEQSPILSQVHARLFFLFCFVFAFSP